MRPPLLLVLLAVASCALPAERGPADAPPHASGPALDGPRLARLIHREVNEARRERGLGALEWSDRLAASALAHSRDMARRAFFGHVTPDGQTTQDRAAAAGIECRIDEGPRVWTGVSENLYAITRYRRYTDTTVDGTTTRQYEWFSADEIARHTVEGWLDSPNHRDNLLSRRAREHGVGISVAPDLDVLVTQVLC